MPRKKLIYTSQFPYHVMARSNNKEWFYLPLDEVWDIFILNLNRVTTEYNFSIFAFVLMNNHYHLLCQTTEVIDLGVIMQDLQKSVSRTINKKAGRTNHIFGGPYKGALITNEIYYSTVFKYVLLNPVNAKICAKVEDYKYSSLNSDRIKSIRPHNGIDAFVPYLNLHTWLNEGYSKADNDSIKNGLRKTEFKPTKTRKY